MAEAGEMKAYLEPQDVAALENAATNVRDRLLIHLLFHLGIRVSEAIALTVEDIDLVHGRITIQHLKRRVRANCSQCGSLLAMAHSYCPRCGSEVCETVVKSLEQRKVRTLPVSDETLEMIGHFIREGGPVSKDGKLLLFGINRHRAWQIVSDCASRVGLGGVVNPDTGKKRGISPHRLRDAFAVHAVKSNDSGDGLRLLQQHMGHASFDTTARYRKVAGEEHRQWYSKLWEREEKGNG